MNAIFKVLYRLYRLFSWLWHWARVRFTRPGLAVLGGMLVAMVMSIDTDNNVDYQAFTFLFCLLLVAASFSLFFRARFSAERHLPRFGTAGHPLQYALLLRNLTSKPQGGLTLLENLADPRPSYDEWHAAQLDQERHGHSFRFSQRRRLNPFLVATVKEAQVPALLPNQVAEVQVQLTPFRRGLLRLSGSTIARPDPLGLFRAFFKMPLPQTVLILPKRYPLPPLALPGAMKYQEGGVALASSVGQSEDFLSLRDYRHGDPLRHIHWRSWARTGKPIVKEFEDEFFVRHALILDTFTDSLHSDVFEEAVSVAASFACTIQTQESLLDLLFVGPQSYCFTTGRGLAQADQMLEILASVRVCRDHPFSALEHLVLEHISVVSGCILVLVAWDEERRNFVEKLQALSLPVMVLLIVPPGRADSVGAGPMAQDPAHFHVLEVGQIEQQLAQLK